MASKKNFYVVWVGREPGIYDNWVDCQEQIDGYPGARYKGFATSAEAAEAYRSGLIADETRELGAMLAGASTHTAPAVKTPAAAPRYKSIAEIDQDGWAVDASCLGNPGVMEYRCVDLRTGREVFRVGPLRQATNNIGEFLAIVHALALMEKTGERHTVYSDSRTGMSWVRRREIKTQLQRTPENQQLFEMMGRALIWIRTHSWNVKVLKWQTELWGEIPADFGRK